MLDAIIDSIDTKDVKFNKIVHVGLAHEYIIKLAKENEYDFIVMSPKGLSNNKHSVIGSVAKKVIAEVKCPVLLVKE